MGHRQWRSATTRTSRACILTQPLAALLSEFQCTAAASSNTTWGFAIYRASRENYENSVLRSGYPAGIRQEASTAPAASTSAPLRPAAALVLLAIVSDRCPF